MKNSTSSVTTALNLTSLISTLRTVEKDLNITGTFTDLKNTLSVSYFCRNP